MPFQAITKHFQALGWKCLCKLSPPQPLWRSSTNISTLLHSRYLGLPPERFQTLTKGQSAQACSFFFFFNRERKTSLENQFIAREIFQQKNPYSKTAMQIASLGCEDEEQKLRDLSWKPWENDTGSLLSSFVLVFNGLSFMLIRQPWSSPHSPFGGGGCLWAVSQGLGDVSGGQYWGKCTSRSWPSFGVRRPLWFGGSSEAGFILALPEMFIWRGKAFECLVGEFTWEAVWEGSL